MTLLIAILLSVSLMTDGEARTPRRECRLACATAIDACHATGAKRAYCRRRILRACRRSTPDVCNRFTTTTGPVSTSTTTTTGSTTTTSPLDRTVNSCNRDHATDLRAETAVMIRAEGFDYAPECIRIAPGTPVTFAMSLTSFPLVGGEDGQPDATSPFGRVDHGYSATFSILAPGVYGYYSDPWWILRMHGAVIVEP